MAQKHKLEEAQNDSGEILNDEQCCALLRIKPRTLRLWRQRRGLPHFKVTSKVVRYSRADVQTWLEQRRVAMVSA